MDAGDGPARRRKRNVRDAGLEDDADDANDADAGALTDVPSAASGQGAKSAADAPPDPLGGRGAPASTMPTHAHDDFECSFCDACRRDHRVTGPVYPVDRATKFVQPYYCANCRRLFVVPIGEGAGYVLAQPRCAPACLDEGGMAPCRAQSCARANRGCTMQLAKIKAQGTLWPTLVFRCPSRAPGRNDHPKYSCRMPEKEPATQKELFDEVLTRRFTVPDEIRRGLERFASKRPRQA